jgi:hypothetical protein
MVPDVKRRAGHDMGHLDDARWDSPADCGLTTQGTAALDDAPEKRLPLPIAALVILGLSVVLWFGIFRLLAALF